MDERCGPCSLSVRLNRPTSYSVVCATITNMYLANMYCVSPVKYVQCVSPNNHVHGRQVIKKIEMTHM